MFGAMDLGIADDGERAGHEQAAQIAVTLLADTAEPVLAPARVLFRHEPDPGREVAPWSEDSRSVYGGDKGGGQHRTAAGDRIEPPARIIGSMQSHDHTVE